jgi:tetratricopeptide (TPR) repeat protein
MLYIIRHLLCLFIFFSFIGKAQNTGTRKVDSLKKIIAVAKNDTVVAKALIDLAWETKYTDPKSAEESCVQAIKHLEHTPSPALRATAYKILGIIFDQYGKYDQSINYYLKAVESFKQISDSLGMARTECNIGMLYRKINQPEAAIPYFNRCLPLFQKNNFVMGVNLANQNLGISYYNLKKFDTALKYFEAALKVLNANNAVDPGLYGNIANCYENLNNPSKRESYMMKCVKAFEEIGDSSSNYFFWIHNLGIYFCHKGEYIKGLDLIERGIKGFNKLGILNTKSGFQMLESAARYYYKSNQLKPAYMNLRWAMNIRDSIYESDIIQQMSEQREKYEADKKELSISNLEKEKKIKDAEIMHQSKQKYAMGIGLILVFALLLVLFKNMKQKKKDHEIIKKQKAIVEQKNKEVTDSISYAKRLQDAILPPVSLMEAFFSESFLIYKPKDIVAGDFFWMEAISPSIESKSEETKILIAAADCTGHGVPGAMVSLVCSTALNRCVKEFSLRKPGEILDKTRELVIETFEKSGTDVKDGMDISLVSIILSHNNTATQIEWAGANNPLWYSDKGTLKEIAGNKQPIGKHADPKPFITHKLELQAGDHIFLLTDGYVDQFGGEKGKKFMTKNLRNLVSEHLHLPMKDQKQVYEKVFHDWMGPLEQVDDVTLIGIKI